MSHSPEQVRKCVGFVLANHDPEVGSQEFRIQLRRNFSLEIVEGKGGRRFWVMADDSCFGW